MSLLWFNNDYLAEEAALITSKDRGFLLGDGIFDTMAAKKGVLQYPDLHMKRLAVNAAVMGLPLPQTTEKILEIAQNLILQNNLISEDASIRTTLTRGTGKRGLAPPQYDNTLPTLLITVTRVDTSLFKAPVKCIIAKTVRRNEGSPLSRIKSLNYGDNILAKLEADKAGANDAILLNNKGHITCATAANIIIEKGGQLLTPPLEDGVLNGTIRQILLSDMNVVEKSFKKDDLYHADHIFLTNSLIELRPVQTINEKNFKIKDLSALKF